LKLSSSIILVTLTSVLLKKNTAAASEVERKRYRERNEDRSG
jgi:hypothetical protein